VSRPCCSIPIAKHTRGCSGCARAAKRTAQLRSAQLDPPPGSSARRSMDTLPGTTPTASR
jgi:hypothetical protein